MEKSQYDLCVEVLKRLEGAGVLRDLILVGSWCSLFYEDYFGDGYHAVVRTRDMDFLVPAPSKIKAKSDVPKLLKDLGFVVGFMGTKGHMRLEHPELIVEFLVPERGRGADVPCELPRLGVNAQPLRFLDLLTANAIKAKVRNVEVTLPHPVNFALYKLIISQRRSKADKAEKDRTAAVATLKSLIEIGKMDEIHDVLGTMPAKWRNKVLKGLEDAGEGRLLTRMPPGEGST